MKSMNTGNWLGFSLSPHMDVSAEPNHQLHHHQPLSPHLTSSGICYEVGGDQNGGFYSQLSFMPLKSDGSLCIMDALTMPQQQETEPYPSPKLEDFLGGGPNMGTHNLDLVQQPFRHQIPVDFQPLHEMYQLPLGGDGYPSLKNWAAMEYGDLQPLSLSMSPGSQSSCVTAPVLQLPPAATKKRGGMKPTVHRKSIDTFGQRTSQYRGVTRHRWTGRYEAHLWDNSCMKEGQTRKGRQVYLGGYDMEEKAARAYDLAALKYWGPSTHVNFPLESYYEELEEMKKMSRLEFIAHLRRKSSGFSRGASIYRGVTRHHQHGRWQARIGRVAGNKDLYLGTFGTQEEAAEAYDVAAIKFRGLTAVTNFNITRYDVERIMASSTLLAGDLARRSKAIEAVNDAPLPQNSRNGSDSKMDTSGALNEKSTTAGGNHQPLFSTALHGLVNDSGSTENTRLSNASSLLTSLSNYATPMNSWIPTAQLRPAIPMAHMPVFAAWSDA